MATFIQERSSASFAASQSLAFSANVSAGSRLIVQLGEGAVSTTDPTVSDSLGNTYELVQRAGRAWTFTTVSASGGANTVSVVGTTVSTRVWIGEFGGSWVGSPTITAPSHVTDSTSPATSPTVTPSAANGILFACNFTIFDCTWSAVSSPYNLGTVALLKLAPAYAINATTTSVACDFTVSAAVSNGSFVQNIHFAETGGGPSPAVLARYRRMCTNTRI